MATTKFFTRSSMLGRARKREAIEIEGGRVYVRALGARDLRDAQLGDDTGTAEGVDATIRVVIASVVDSKGEPLFTDADADALLDQPIGDLNLIATTAFRLSGIDTDALAEATDPLAA